MWECCGSRASIASLRWSLCLPPKQREQAHEFDKSTKPTGRIDLASGGANLWLRLPVWSCNLCGVSDLSKAGYRDQHRTNGAEHCRPSELFAAAILCYLIEFIEDIVIAWALYVLLVPVNRAVWLLTAWFRLVYTAIALFGMLKLVTVFRVVDAPDYLAAFGPNPPPTHGQTTRSRAGSRPSIGA